VAFYSHLAKAAQLLQEGQLNNKLNNKLVVEGNRGEIGVIGPIRNVARLQTLQTMVELRLQPSLPMLCFLQQHWKEIG
jgi:hypothetical protein